jgi:hypothetical protein
MNFYLGDGTFKVCPTLFVQLYTIHGYEISKYVPLLFGLLQHKTEQSYVLFLTKIRDKCAQLEFQFEPSVVMLDFEIAAHKAASAVFPNAQILACRFHIGQSWWRHIQKIGLSAQYKDTNCDISKWLRRFFALPLLPASEVEDAFAMDIMDDMWTKFADYVYENYIDSSGRCNPTIWADQPHLRRTTSVKLFIAI